MDQSGTAKSDVSEQESAQRERHLKGMRDRIVSAKRAGREEEASKAASDCAAAAGAAAAAAAEKRTIASPGGAQGEALPFFHRTPLVNDVSLPINSDKLAKGDVPKLPLD